MRALSSEARQFLDENHAAPLPILPMTAGLAKMVGDLVQKADVPRFKAIEESLISQLFRCTLVGIDIVEICPRNMIDVARGPAC